VADLDDLDPHARALLNAYRARTGPPADVQARLRAAVLRDAEAMSEATGPDAHVRELRPRARWVGPVVLAALAAAIVAAVSLRHAEPQVVDRTGAAAPWELAPPAPGTAAQRRPAPSAGAATPAPTEPAAPATTVEPATTAEPAATDVLEPARPARPTLRASPSEPAPKDSPAPPPADGLAAEMAQMRPAQRALAEDRPTDALAALAGYAARFPAGLLREEHDALHAIALCAAGREREGRGEARVFLRERPTSMFAARVRIACGLDG
jgi:hypothetical protein